MLKEESVNLSPMTESAQKNWYLSVKSPSPKQTISVKFADGKTYKYLGTGKVNAGDPVLIDYGGATSYMMGNVDGTEDGITIKRTHALKPLFAFSTAPTKAEIKKNFESIYQLEDIGEASDWFNMKSCGPNEDRFRIVDFLVLSVLNAITVVAYPSLAGESAVNDAKQFLAQELPVPGVVFGKEFCDLYYGEFMPGLRLADRSEVALTGFYPDWKDTLLNGSFWESDQFKALRIKTSWNNDGTVYYLYFKNGSSKLKKYFADCDEFRAITNELVMRSALSILIRGGFVNLLQTALSVEMPIKGFYQKLIDFADKVGSTECAKLLKSIDYEKISFTNDDQGAAPDASGAKKKADDGKGKKAVRLAGKDFKIVDTTLVEYKGAEEEVTVPDGIKVIDQWAFSENEHIRKVILPDSVTQIKKGAFSHCPQLEEVVIGKNLSSLGVACFYCSPKLRIADLINTKIKVLNESVFEGCSSLQAMDLSRTKVTEIKGKAFWRCESLVRVVLPETLQSIGDSAFRDCGIVELTIPAAVNRISHSAFGQTSFDPVDTPLKKIVFCGTDAINFTPESVGTDCVICCKKDSELWGALEEENARLSEEQSKWGDPGIAPRQLEAL